MMAPELSVVVLTRNEEANLADALDSLVAQEGVALEAIVVDSASRDRTLEIARRYEAAHPDVVRVVASPEDIPIGVARNLGIAHARAPLVAQMSADAMAAPGWGARMVAALAGCDLAYGRQEHAPDRLTAAAVVRGLRYHHFDAKPAAPETYASNVNAGMRREVLERVRFVPDGPASALDDILLTREAMELGFRVGYDAQMLVRHKDATTLQGELRKNRREGYGWGLLSPKLGLHKMAIAWGASLAALVVALAAWPSIWLAAILLGTIYAPTLRRAALAGGRFAKAAPLALLGAIAVGPALDLAFLYHYVLGLKDRRADLTGRLPAGGNAA